MSWDGMLEVMGIGVLEAWRRPLSLDGARGDVRKWMNSIVT